jgi:hypothetical protein
MSFITNYPSNVLKASGNGNGLHHNTKQSKSILFSFQVFAADKWNGAKEKHFELVKI